MATKRSKANCRDFPQALTGLMDKIRPPLAIILGSPREVVDLVKLARLDDTRGYQMDLYQAGRLEKELAESGLNATVVTGPDLWDLPADFNTAIYPAPEGGERILKLDMIEQAYQILRPEGILIVISPYQNDQLFPKALKKIYGRIHGPPGGQGNLFWCRRGGHRPRRRHEMTFQARMPTGGSLRFLSRPGVFSYGRFDNGARALVETIEIAPGERVIDIGCGCGTNGIWAAELSGPDGFTAFVDSNVRAVALAEMNARANGVPCFLAVASAQVQGVPPGFNVALANPPYYAQLNIAQLFIERSRELLKPGGRLYLVTKQPDQVGPMVAESFGRTDAVERRGYVVLCANRA
jgi:16S rRNA (guanine1207-N2)-methyltransferase